MKKGDFINKLKEGGSLDPKNLETTTQNLEKVNQNIEKIKNNVNQLKNMGVIAEDLDIANDYESNTDFFKDMIDKLMIKKFNKPFFKSDNPNIKPILTMNDIELNDLVDGSQNGRNLIYVRNLILKGLDKLKSEPNLDLTVNHPLKDAYLVLQDYSRNMKENFVNQKIFNILAEVETPKVSKKEILEFLNLK
jgi:hypothetical protein